MIVMSLMLRNTLCDPMRKLNAFVIGVGMFARVFLLIIFSFISCF